FVWAGYTLAQFNLLLSMTPDRGRERYVALYQTAVFFAAFLGPLIGASLVNQMGYRLMFVLSAIGRLVATALFIQLMTRRPRRASGRVETVRSDEDETDSSD
ncbi:MAG: MFS transporter, partial [Anaerolineae bacterium]|nr:MFS transporter [Anaerolineae bacterium]